MSNVNMTHWDALKATDPKYTKKVEFGRKFTSINSQWQIQRMTEQFGPVGKGWGHSVVHSVERITDDYVLAIADVTIWWLGDINPASLGQMPASKPRHEYGPIRGMSPILEKNRFDDDAGKKAMTDALTKGLSHLGLSADVFLGLFDDNKYVREIAKEFANGNGGNAPAAMDAVHPDDRHMVQGDGRSAYRVAADEKAPGRQMAEFWASQVLTLFKQPGYDLLQFKEWKQQPCSNKGTKTNEQKLSELREKHNDLGQAIDKAIDLLPVARAA